MSPRIAFDVLYARKGFNSKLESLYELSDHQLKDIGLCRGEVHTLNNHSNNDMRGRLRKVIHSVTSIFS